ncbi:MAG: radical SAM protein [Planctomycetota bacterium]|nr:radical SAM protein [Planctomycetota bacterium]
MDGTGPSSGRPRFTPRLIAWELTRACRMACRHCRAAARPVADADDLTTDEGYRLLENIASFCQPILILTGGEPLLRGDVFDLAKRGRALGLPVVLATCGMGLDDETAQRLMDAGIRHISISLDGATAKSHDAIRGVPGAFDAALRGIEAAKRAGLSFQVNTTVARYNVAELPAIRDLAICLGAIVFNPFFLVPTGRGREIADEELSAEEYEATLRWLAEQRGKSATQIRVTCAPQYQRILRERRRAGEPEPQGQGCMGGKSFAFVAHNGKVQICGFLDVECGDLRREGFDFHKIWETSEVFRKVRDVGSYRESCGECEYGPVCGGCRARAYAMTGDYLSEEPFCLYRPKRTSAKE